jgi:hypothetical protein
MVGQVGRLGQSRNRRIEVAALPPDEGCAEVRRFHRARPAATGNETAGLGKTVGDVSDIAVRLGSARHTVAAHDGHDIGTAIEQRHQCGADRVIVARFQSRRFVIVRGILSVRDEVAVDGDVAALRIRIWIRGIELVEEFRGGVKVLAVRIEGKCVC